MDVLPRSQRAAAIGGVRRLTDKMTVMDGGGSNVLAFSTGEGFVLVDSGAPKSGDQVMAALKAWRRTPRSTRSSTPTITSIRPATTKCSRRRARRSSRTSAPASGCRPTTGFRPKIATKRPAPKPPVPPRRFSTTGSLKAGGEQIDYGYLPLAHTNGDIYVFFKNANVLAVGDVASPLRDPALDYFTGAWIGGRVDAMDILLDAQQ